MPNNTGVSQLDDQGSALFQNPMFNSAGSTQPPAVSATPISSQTASSNSDILTNPQQTPGGSDAQAAADSYSQGHEGVLDNLAASTSAGTRLFINAPGDIANGFMIFYSNTVPYIVQFQGIPEGISESRTAEYQTINIAKRMEPLLIYQFSGFRTISFELKFGVFCAQDAKSLYMLMSLIRRSVLPTQRGMPMYGKLNLGAWFKNFKAHPHGFEVDDYTSNTVNFVIKSYTITPSKERILDPDGINGQLAGNQNTQGINWRSEKIPATVNIKLDLNIFSQIVWSGASSIDAGDPSVGSQLEKDSKATNLPSLRSSSSTQSNTPDGSSTGGSSSDIKSTNSMGLNFNSDSLITDVDLIPSNNEVTLPDSNIDIGSPVDSGLPGSLTTNDGSAGSFGGNDPVSDGTMGSGLVPAR